MIFALVYQMGIWVHNGLHVADNAFIYLFLFKKILFGLYKILTQIGPCKKRIKTFHNGAQRFEFLSTVFCKVL